MALDLDKTAAQLGRLTASLRQRGDVKADALAQALTALREADPEAVEARRAGGRVTWLVAGVEESLRDAFAAPSLPDDYLALSVDGSHVDVDRHSPARCYLINIGSAALRYGARSGAALRSAPTLYARDEELALADPAAARDMAVEGPLLGMVRAVAEVEALADLVEASPPDAPTVALLDGTLVLWGLAGQGYPEFVRRRLLEDGLLPALDRLRSAAKGRTLAVASYISLPRSTEVMNALRLHVCPYERVDCDAHCGALRSGTRPCDAVGGLTDGELAAAALRPGERSAVFRSNSGVVSERYGPHAVRFFYLNVGEEVARVETPEWTARDPEALALLHAALLSQADKGHGYPAALQEAHEQAVISGRDREGFALLVEQAMTAEGLPTATSQKARSKRTRWV
ncbi:MAG: DNA double-strand break repair nuclease NurA [Dehalococcoidia bacterium]|nr:DNA double-strand break repair nuclease NurA [Dehalococcoidia bacterium]